MFSATFPKEIEELAIKHLNNPEKIFVQKDNQSNVVADNLTQEVVNIKDIGEKYKILLEQLISREGTIIVFFQRKIDVDYFGRKLHDDGIITCKIHGDLRQKTRERTINDFKNGRYRILLGTDIVARGLDVPHVKYVINYDIPEDPEEYIHRIGRTARAGENGTAVTFLTNNYKDIKKWENIQFLLHPELKKNNHEFNKNNYRINRKRNTCRNMFSHKRKIFNIRNKIK
jgi:superfamily II DNA/RNA helicase